MCVFSYRQGHRKTTESQTPALARRHLARQKLVLPTLFMPWEGKFGLLALDGAEVGVWDSSVFPYPKQIRRLHDQKRDLIWSFIHTESDFVASTKRFVNIASANQELLRWPFILLRPQLWLLWCQIVVVTIAIVTTRIWFAEAILTNRLAEATKSYSPWTNAYQEKRNKCVVVVFILSFRLYRLSGRVPNINVGVSD